jgi:hypothetical protein
MRIHSLNSYIIHYTKLFERSQNCQKLSRLTPQSLIVTEHKINQKLVERFREYAIKNQHELVCELVPYILEGVVINAKVPLSLKSRGQLQSIFKTEGITVLTKHLPFLDLNPPSRSTIEHVLQHYYALSHLVCNGYEWSLVLEDDAVLLDKERLNNLNSILESLNFPFPVFIDISDGCRLQSEDIHDKRIWLGGELFYMLQTPRTRTSHAYIVNNAFAQVAFKSRNEIYMAIDWHFSYCINKFKAFCLWIDRPIVTEGSACGKYGSNAVSRGKSLY